MQVRVPLDLASLPGCHEALIEPLATLPNSRQWQPNLKVYLLVQDLQSPELKAIRERFDPSLPVMLYGSSKGCASMMKMIFSQGNDALTRMDQRLTNFACFSAQATVADVEYVGLKTPGILSDTVNKIYFFNCVNDKLVPFEGGRSGRRGPFVSGTVVYGFDLSQFHTCEVVRHARVSVQSYGDNQLCYWAMNQSKVF